MWSRKGKEKWGEKSNQGKKYDHDVVYRISNAAPHSLGFTLRIACEGQIQKATVEENQLFQKARIENVWK